MCLYLIMDLNKGWPHFLFYYNLAKMYLQQPAVCPSLQWSPQPSTTAKVPHHHTVHLGTAVSAGFGSIHGQENLQLNLPPALHALLVSWTLYQLSSPTKMCDKMWLHSSYGCNQLLAPWGGCPADTAQGDCRQWLHPLLGQKPHWKEKIVKNYPQRSYSQHSQLTGATLSEEQNSFLYYYKN